MVCTHPLMHVFLQETRTRRELQKQAALDNTQLAQTHRATLRTADLGRNAVDESFFAQFNRSTR